MKFTKSFSRVYIKIRLVKLVTLFILTIILYVTILLISNTQSEYFFLKTIKLFLNILIAIPGVLECTSDRCHRERSPTTNQKAPIPI